MIIRQQLCIDVLIMYFMVHFLVNDLIVFNIHFLVNELLCGKNGRSCPSPFVLLQPTFCVSNFKSSEEYLFGLLQFCWVNIGWLLKDP